MRVQSGDIDKAKQLIPNAFIPTSSNTLNATFDPVQVLLDNAIIIQESELFIINRWGEIVLHQRAGSGASNPWDGAQNHHPLPMGTYYYKLRVLSGDTYLLQGPVNLMR
jgi:gliding motility-associated-like protein